MSKYLGDFLAGATVHGSWNTNGADGASITRGTNGTLSVYKDADDTQTTTGVTDAEDDDSLTGWHRYTIATTDSFYTPGTNYQVVLSAAAIDGQTVNAVVGEFSIQNRYVPGLIARGLMQSGSTSTTAILAAATSFANDLIIGATLVITHGTGKGQARIITDWVSASDTATVDTWTTTPDNTSYYEIVATAPGSTVAPAPVDLQTIKGQTVTCSGGVTVPAATLASTTNITAGTITTVTTTTNLTNAATAGDFTATMKTSIGTAVAASAVASVTGNVGGNVTGSVGSVTGNVGGNVVGSVASVTANVNADVKKINGTPVTGDGSEGDPWGPA